MEDYRERIVYSKDFGKAPSNDDMPSQDEIEAMAILETTVSNIMLLPRDQQEATIAELSKIPGAFSKTVLHLVQSRRALQQMQRDIEGDDV